METLLPGEHGPGLCSIGLTVGLLPVAAVLLPAVRDPMIALSTVEGLERDCAEVGEESITVHGGWSGPNVAMAPAVVVMVEMDALPMGNDAPLDCADGCPAWDGGCQREMVDGVTISCGDDWCDLAFRQVHFLRVRMIRYRWLYVMTNCFRMTFWPLCLCRFVKKCLR